MGNCCGSAKSESTFQGQGRTLNATPANAPPPKSGQSAATPYKVTGPGRTLGSTPASPNPAPQPGEAAARAAEARVKSPVKPQGKLGRQLEEQRNQTHNETLNQIARDNLAARNADDNTRARTYD